MAIRKGRVGGRRPRGGGNPTAANSSRGGALALLLLATALLALSGCGSNRTPELLAEGQPTREGFRGELRVEPRKNLLVVPVQVGGRELRFLLDSGAPTAITPTLQRELGLDAESTTRATDVRGTETEVEVVRLPEVLIAGVGFERIAAVVFDLRAVPDLRCLGVDGLLGANLLRQAVWEMDLGEGHLRFADRLDALGLPANSHRVRFITADSGAPVIRPVIAGTPVPDMFLDTGANVGLVAPPAAMPAGAREGRSVEAVGSSGAGALGYGSLSGRTRFAVVEAIELGEMVITDQVVEFRDENSLMGTHFLRDYLVTLNWRGREVFFSPDPEPVEEDPGSFGFNIQPRQDRLIASQVFMASPAWEAGMRPGDTIVAVDGQRLEPLPEDRYCRILEEGLVPPSRESLRLTFRGEGRERTIRLRRFELVLESPPGSDPLPESPPRPDRWR